jgi:hypothetical protein
VHRTLARLLGWSRKSRTATVPGVSVNGSQSWKRRGEATEARLATFSSPEVVEMHPRAAERYRQKVEDIQAALTAGDLASFEAVALVRELVQSVRVVPTPGSEPVGLEITGDLAALLTVNEEGTPGMVTMVAGVGFDEVDGARSRHRSAIG